MTIMNAWPLQKQGCDNCKRQMHNKTPQATVECLMCTTRHSRQLVVCLMCTTRHSRQLVVCLMCTTRHSRQLVVCLMCTARHSRQLVVCLMCTTRHSRQLVVCLMCTVEYVDNPVENIIVARGKHCWIDGVRSTLVRLTPGLVFSDSDFSCLACSLCNEHWQGNIAGLGPQDQLLSVH